jgi:hypothetical protein
MRIHRALGGPEGTPGGGDVLAEHEHTVVRFEGICHRERIASL